MYTVGLKRCFDGEQWRRKWGFFLHLPPPTFWGLLGVSHTLSRAARCQIAHVRFARQDNMHAHTHSRRTRRINTHKVNSERRRLQGDVINLCTLRERFINIKTRVRFEQLGVAFDDGFTEWFIFTDLRGNNARAGGVNNVRYPWTKQDSRATLWKQIYQLQYQYHAVLL